MRSLYKTCPKGHKYIHTSDCPVCPICWPNYYKEHSTGDFDMLAAPAQRALDNAGIKTLKDLTKKTELEIASLHGIGPNALEKLKDMLKIRNLEFKKKIKSVD